MHSVHSRPQRPCRCSILPPHVLAQLVEEGTEEQRRAALNTLATSATARSQRALIGRIARTTDTPLPALVAALVPPAGGRQTIYDAQHGGLGALPGHPVWRDGDPAPADPAVDEVRQNTETTYDFYRAVFNRDSVDGKGMELASSVHVGTGWDNAMWNGAQMVYGDGSGQLFAVGALVKALDVIGHELTHGVTQFTAGLEYRSQPGALNESFSDVFGSLVKQYSLGQTAEAADWLIGEGTILPQLGRALRSMAQPGTAFKYDNQPATMADYVDLPDDNDPQHDNGGVHINSGIPNHAFYLAATRIGGHAWEKAGKIWYETLTGGHLKPDASFADAAQATVQVAEQLFGAGAEHDAVQSAWHDVGVL